MDFISRIVEILKSASLTGIGQMILATILPLLIYKFIRMLTGLRGKKLAINLTIHLLALILCAYLFSRLNNIQRILVSIPLAIQLWSDGVELVWGVIQKQYSFSDKPKPWFRLGLTVLSLILALAIAFPGADTPEEVVRRFTQGLSQVLASPQSTSIDLSLFAPDCPMPSQVSIANSQGANVRQGTSRESAQLDFLPNGTLIQTLAYDAQTDWILIQLPNGAQGWIWAGLTDWGQAC